MILTPRIKPRSTLRTLTPTSYILIHTQHMLALSTQNGMLMSPIQRPRHRVVGFARSVAGDAGVELFAAEMLDGDYVEGGVIVMALRERS